MATPQERSWQVSEARFFPDRLHHSETIYTVGNGYMGLRATFEEDYPGQFVSTLVHGIFDHAEGELVPELVNLPNPLPITIEVDGETFGLDHGTVLGFSRVLDLKQASLSRGVTWRNSKGAVVQITFERFASLEQEHLLAQRVVVRALTQPCTIRIVASIDGRQTNEGVWHWAELDSGPADKQRIYVFGETGQSHYHIAVMSSLIAADPAHAITTLPSPIHQPALMSEFTLDVDQAATFDKFNALHTSRDPGDPLVAAHLTLDDAQARGWDALLTAHAAEWATYWHESDIEIEGDEPAQRAIRFAMYHVLIAAPRHDENVSIGAKTLAGLGYKGHVFWDTELFMLPFLTVTQPDLARNLVMYRYHRLLGARKKARENGFEGAMFPWESTDTGEETTPRWSLPEPDGTRFRIWTGDTEQHISTDIAYAVLQFWRWTGDDDFFAKYGAEIVLDTAIFWGSRIEYNDGQDRFELSMQIGPDEYHENVNNSAFTNSMVRWHLQSALQVRDWLLEHRAAEANALFSSIGLTDDKVAHWREIIDKMYVPHDEQRGILEQFDGFFNLQPLNLAHWQPRTANMDWILGHEPIQHIMVIKQADIVMLMALLGDEFGSVEERLRNWQLYWPVADHGSSLSLSIHAWVAARLGLVDQAYELYMRGAAIDLEDSKGNVRDGIHGAASGGLWEAIVFGFAGVSVKNGELVVDPHLPAHWKKMTFRVRVNGKQQTVRLSAE